jgi:hypothetical protein
MCRFSAEGFSLKYSDGRRRHGYDGKLGMRWNW